MCVPLSLPDTQPAAWPISRPLHALCEASMQALECPLAVHSEPLRPVKHGVRSRSTHPAGKCGRPMLRAGLLGAKGNYRTVRATKGHAVKTVLRVSMINAADSRFLPPVLPAPSAPRRWSLWGPPGKGPPAAVPLYDPRKFPKTSLPDDGYGFNEYNVHFLSLCMKVGPGTPEHNPSISLIP